MEKLFSLLVVSMVFLSGCVLVDQEQEIIPVQDDSGTSGNTLEIEIGGEEDSGSADGGEAMDEEPPETAIVPGVTVSAQEVADGTVTVAEVVAPEKGWIVIHRDSGSGTPGPVIGQAQVERGTNTNVIVAIGFEDATPTLFAMLHSDDKVEGLYEFPDADAPVRHDEKVVVKPFSATNVQAPEPEPEEDTGEQPDDSANETGSAGSGHYIESDDSGFYLEDGTEIMRLDAVAGENVKITFFIREEGTYFGGLTIRGPGFDSGKLEKGETYVLEFTAGETHQIKSYWPESNRLKATLDVVVG